jgi:hypothetical protein
MTAIATPIQSAFSAGKPVTAVRARARPRPERAKFKSMPPLVDLTTVALVL